MKKRGLEQRLKERETELRGLHERLYQSPKAWEAFVQMLRKMGAARSEKLQQLDVGRQKTPGWYYDRRQLGMQLYPQCFGGTLSGVEEHLDYLQESQVTWLHLMPILKSPKGRSDGGYAVADFRQVQPELGRMADLEHLTEACHEKDMAVCLDFVMNHTSEDHEWAIRARKGEKEYQDRYFFFKDWSLPQRYEQTVPQVFPTTAPGNFTWCEEAGKVVMTTFYPYQWDLNYGNPAVFQDMTENLLYLCNRGVDVIRLDAVPYIWKELGTTCRNLPQVHMLVRMLRLACEIVCPGVVLLGEVVMEPAKLAPYFGSVERPECQMLYNANTMATTWHTVATKDVRLLRHQMESLLALPKQDILLNYLRCHDDIGWGLDYDYLKQLGMQEVPHKKFLNDYFLGLFEEGDARGELYNADPLLGDARLCGTTASLCGLEGALQSGNEKRIEKALALDVMLHAFLMTQSGIPVLYSGDEIGQLNDYRYKQNPDKAADSRYVHRGAFDWKQAERRQDETEASGRLYQSIHRLVDIRRTYSVFSADAECWMIETGCDHILGIGRYRKGRKLIALFNFSPEPQTAHIAEHEEYVELWSSQPARAKDVRLDGYGFVWLHTVYSQEP